MSRPALVVYTKELLDTLRDRRTLATMILVPMVVYPATLLLTTETMVATERAAEEEVLEVGAAPALPPRWPGTSPRPPTCTSPPSAPTRWTPRRRGKR